MLLLRTMWFEGKVLLDLSHCQIFLHKNLPSLGWAVYGKVISPIHYTMEDEYEMWYIYMCISVLLSLRVKFSRQQEATFNRAAAGVTNCSPIFGKTNNHMGHLLAYCIPPKPFSCPHSVSIVSCTVRLIFSEWGKDKIQSWSQDQFETNLSPLFYWHYFFKTQHSFQRVDTALCVCACVCVVWCMCMQ